MLTKKSLGFKEIIESKGGMHLSAYLQASDDPMALKVKMRDIVLSAYEHLLPSLTREARNSFLRPITGLMADQRLIESLTGQNLAIFRNQDLFRVVSLPRQTEDQFFVSTSFHVKPLLEWMQIDREFLIVGLSEGESSLYVGSLQSFRKADEIRGQASAELLRAGSSYLRKRKVRDWWADETGQWLRAWIKENVRGEAPKIYLAGEWKFVRRQAKVLRRLQVSVQLAGKHFTDDDAFELCREARRIQEVEARDALIKSYIEFYHAEAQNSAKKNLLEIASAAARGQVRKLIIASGIHIFGRVDEKTGALRVNANGSAHDTSEDDDVLDDLAQLVMSRGGEVLVAPLSEIPRKRPALAILHPLARPPMETQPVQNGAVMAERRSHHAVGN